MGLTINSFASNDVYEKKQANPTQRGAINIYDLPAEILRQKNGIQLDFDESGYIDTVPEFGALDRILKALGMELKFGSNKRFDSTNTYTDEKYGVEYMASEGFDKKGNLMQSTLTFSVGDLKYSVIIDYDFVKTDDGSQTIKEKFRVFAQSENGTIELKENNKETKNLRQKVLNTYDNVINEYIHSCKHEYEFFL